MLTTGLPSLTASLWIPNGPTAGICHTRAYEPEPPFPLSWFNDFGTFTREREAVFARYWLQITHGNRVRRVGDYARLDIAGHRLVLVKGVDRALHVFRNERRGEGRLVVRRRQGHGVPVHEDYEWSLNIEGSVVRLPCTLNSRSQSSVQLVHMHVDKHGFVWVNLDGRAEPQVSWEEQAACVDAMEKFRGFRASNYAYSHSWSAGGDFDWKTFVDYHFNEYCHTTINPRSRSTSVPAKGSEARDNMVVSFDRESLISPTYIFPATMITFNDTHMCLVRCDPTGPGQADIHVEIYRQKTCSSADFFDMEDFLKEILREDITLCNMRQHVLNRSHYKPGGKWDNKTGAGSWLRTIKTILECR